MRITFILPFASLAGGIRVITEYARELVARGHDVTVVSRPDTRDSGLKRRLRIALGREAALPRRQPTPLLDFLGPRHVVSRARQGIAAHEVPDGDVVIATWWETAEWVAALPPAKGRKFYLIQGYEVSPERDADRIAATFATDLRKIAVSGYIRDAIRQNHAPKGEIAVLPNAVDTDHFAVPARGRNADLTVGVVYSRLAIKNIPLASRALELARARYPALKALAFGRGPVAEDVPLPDWVRYERAPAQDDMRDLYAACDAWLFPTEREGFGLPILEAMACRTPVLATDAGAAPDLIDGKNGLILPHDPEAFAAAILRFADMADAEWRGWSDAAHATAQENRWSDATERLLAVLQG